MKTEPHSADYGIEIDPHVRLSIAFVSFFFTCRGIPVMIYQFSSLSTSGKVAVVVSAVTGLVVAYLAAAETIEYFSEDPAETMAKNFVGDRHLRITPQHTPTKGAEHPAENPPVIKL